MRDRDIVYVALTGIVLAGAVVRTEDDRHVEVESHQAVVTIVEAPVAGSTATAIVYRGSDGVVVTSG